jgi:hypothetical protein
LRAQELLTQNSPFEISLSGKEAIDQEESLAKNGIFKVGVDQEDGLAEGDIVLEGDLVEIGGIGSLPSALFSELVWVE